MKIADLEGVTDTAALIRVREAALGAPAWDGPPVWIHGDLAPGNLLVRGGRLSAVIDFGCLAVGDPACDLIVAWSFLPVEVRDAFREMLDVDDATWTRGRGWGLAVMLPTLDDFVASESEARRVVAEFVADHERDG